MSWDARHSTGPPEAWIMTFRGPAAGRLWRKGQHVTHPPTKAEARCNSSSPVTWLMTS